LSVLEVKNQRGMKISLIASPYDSGYHKKRLALGTLALKDSLGKHLGKNNHEFSEHELILPANPFPTEVTESFAVNRALSAIVGETKARGEFPIVLAGNCNTAVGTLGGLAEENGVIWFDCHGDFNTPETTIGGFLDGMALAMVTGRCWKSLTEGVHGFSPVTDDKIVLIGARDFDPEERKNLAHSAIQLITPAMLKDSVANLDDHFPSLPAIYLHIDLDVIDPKYVMVNSYSTPGGLLPEDLYNVITFIKKQYIIAAMAFTAYDPSLDPDKKIKSVVNTVTDIVTGVF
jgi:arginase